jgi:hypothetical protein
MRRLIYKSRSILEIDWNLVHDILHASERNNKQRNVTGVLLATRRHFLQVLEGQSDDLSDTFTRIVRDPRHEDIKLISFNVVESRLFDAWAMRGIGVFDFNKDIEAQLVRKYGKEEDGARFPLEEWRALAMIYDISMFRDSQG